MRKENKYDLRKKSLTVHILNVDLASRILGAE